MAHPTLHGIVPPIITPMNADESINIPELRNQIERQIAGGVHGIFCFGTNGEGYILSMKEKEEILEATIDQVAGRVPVYAGTGCISTADTVYMSRRAEECQQRISTLQCVFKFGNPNTIIKKAVNLLGYPVGECRRPFNYLCDEGVAELKAVLKENEELGLC